jgi:hypothetical protein
LYTFFNFSDQKVTDGAEFLTSLLLRSERLKKSGQYSNSYIEIKAAKIVAENWVSKVYRVNKAGCFDVEASSLLA